MENELKLQMSIDSIVSSISVFVESERYTVVEACGTPGSGKTYWSSRLKKNACANNVEFNYHSIDQYSVLLWKRAFIKLGIIIRMLLGEYRILTTIVSLISCVQHLNLKTRFKLSFNLMLICSVILERRDISIPLLLDQGILQIVWSCFYYSKQSLSEAEITRLEAKFYKLLSYLRVDHLLVLDIRAQENIVVDRLITRENKGTSELNSLLDKHIKKGFQASDELRKFLVRIEHNCRKIKIFRVTNDL